MVKTIKYLALVIGFLLLSMNAAFAASFTASIDRTQVAPGESLTLELSLSGASPKGSPDFNPLEDNFTIYSQGQSQQTTIINTHISSSINWQLTLIPKKSGDITIPALSIDTDEGRLQSQPVTVSVSKSSALTRNGAETGNSPLIVTTEVSKTNPYKNEPVLYTVKLIARRSVSDVSIPEFNAEGAIVKKEGDAKIYDAVLQGQRVKVIEMRYLITPLQSGKINIPEYVFQGKVESDMQRSDFFRGLLDDQSNLFKDFDSFPGFPTFKPFSVSGQELSLNVKPPVVKMDSWLPLTSLSIADSLDGAKNAKVGEPLTRKIKLTAKGTVGAALPDLDSSIAPADSFRIYADKPKTGEKFSQDGAAIFGWREESYTLIPKKSGTLTLPEIKVPWWDVKNNKISYATLPQRTIDVQPGEAVAGNNAGTAALSQAQAAKNGHTNGQQPSATTRPGSVKEKLPKRLYGILAALVLAVIILAGVVLYLFRKLSSNNKQASDTNDKFSESASAAASQSKLTISDLKRYNTPEELRKFLQTYAFQHWETPQNAALRTILTTLKTQSVQTDTPETKQVFSDLDAALYAGKEIDVEDTKKRLGAILKATDKIKAPTDKQRANMGDLNPT